jgi:ABC-type Fe3+/spermidine/putrescine transport system ATPase subunit
MSTIELRGVAKHFGATPVLTDVDLVVPDGSTTAVLGESGSGKTTLLRLIAGFEQVDAGTVAIDGRIVDDGVRSVRAQHRGVGYVPQEGALFPHLTVLGNVGFGVPRSERPRAIELIEMVGLGGLERRYPHQLSGGQQQRVALARAIVIEPAVLLLDEPLSNLDANLREEMRFEIRRLHDAFKITTVYVTHDQTEAMVTSDRIAVMNQGRIEQIDKPHTLYNRPRTRFVAGFIGRTNIVEGDCDGNLIVFDRFAVPNGLIAGGAGLRGKATFSIRPHGMRLLRDRPDGSIASVEVCILERAYLGEHWDYIVVPRDGTLRLKVAAPPLQEFAIGEAAWLDFDTRQIALIN